MTRIDKKKAEQELNILINRYPRLEPFYSSIFASYEIIIDALQKGCKILTCGNGGSASDSDHIVGELMKSFCSKRPIEETLKAKLIKIDPTLGKKLGDNLEGAIPAINLTQHTALSSAYSNDNNPSLVFAQQVLGYGNEGDILIGISTSGNSENVILAAIVAKAKGLKVISLSGEKKAKLDEFSDISIKVPETETYKIQELHLPIYHTLCLMLEVTFWSEKK